MGPEPSVSRLHAVHTALIEVLADRGGLEEWKKASPHALRGQLAKQCDLDLSRLVEAWKGLTDARIEQYGHATPPSWSDGDRALKFAIQHIKNVRNNINAAAAEVLRVLK